MSDLHGTPDLPDDSLDIDPAISERLSTVADGAGRRSTPPVFASIRTRGRRRVRAVRIGATTLAVVAVAIVGLGIHVVSDAANSDHVVNHGLPTTGIGVVHSPQATLIALAADSTFPRIRATEWRVCATTACTNSVSAVAVTSDGFAHQHDYLVSSDSPLVSPFILPGGSAARGWFLVEIGDRPTLVDAAGHQQVAHISTHATPLRSVYPRSLDTLVAMPEPDGTVRALGLSLAHATLYPVTVPAAARFASVADVGLVTESIWGIDTDGSVWESGDRGKTWRHAPVQASSPLMVASTSPTDQAIASVDVNGSLRLDSLARSLDEGHSWLHLESAVLKGCTAAWATELSSGQLLAAVNHGTATTPPGLYASRFADWTLMSRIPQRTSQLDIATTRYLASTLQPILHEGEQGRKMLYVSSHGNTLWASSTAGHGWFQMRAR